MSERKPPLNGEVHVMLLKAMKLVNREAAVSDVCVQPCGGACTAKINGQEVTFKTTQLGLMGAVLSNAPLKENNGKILEQSQED